MRLVRYVTLRAAAGVALALIVVGAVVELVAFAEVSRAASARGDMGFADVLRLSLMKSPAVMLQLTPFVCLFGVMGAFVTLNRRHELVAIRACGVSAWRIVTPVAAAAWVFGLVGVTVINPLATAMNGQYEREKLAIATGADRNGPRDIWLRQARRGEQTIIHGLAPGGGDPTIRLKAVSIFVQRLDSSGGLGVARRIEAGEAVLTPGLWRLREAREASVGAEMIRSDELTLPTELDQRNALDQIISPSATSFWRLPAMARAASHAGYSARSYRLRWLQLIAQPFLLAAMTLLGAAFSMRLIRLGGLAAQSALGVGLGFAAFMINQVCGALGGNGALPLILAAWAPPLLTALCAISLLCYTEDG